MYEAYPITNNPKGKRNHTKRTNTNERKEKHRERASQKGNQHVERANVKATGGKNFKFNYQRKLLHPLGGGSP